MRPSPKLHPTAWDALVVLCVAALAIALALFQWRGGTSQALTAVVSVDGTEVDRFAPADLAASLWRTPPERKPIRPGLTP